MSYPTSGGGDHEFTNQAASSGSQFDIKKFIYKIISFLPWFILSLAISLFASKMYLRYTLPTHKISAFLLIKQDDKGGQSDFNVLRDLGLVSNNKDVENEIDIIKSYTMLKRVVDSLRLNIKIYKEGRVTISPIYGEKSPCIITVAEEFADGKLEAFKAIFKRESFQIIGGTPGGKTYNYGDTVESSYGKLIFERNPKVKVDPNGYSIIIENKESIAADIRGRINIMQTHSLGGILDISILDEIPQRAINTLNTLIQVYNSAGLDDKNIVGVRTIKFLNERIDTVQSELSNIEIQAETFKKLNKISSI